jgi:hypothetical protein
VSRRPISAAVLGAAALIGAAGCSGAPPAASASTSSATSSSATSSSATTSSCSATGSASPPAGFPSSLPLPAGTVLTSSETRSGQRLVVNGTAPRDFSAVLAELQAAYPAAGFPLSGGEVEKDKGDAESNFAGNGYTGRWSLRGITGCAATTVSLVVQKTG